MKIVIEFDDFKKAYFELFRKRVGTLRLLQTLDLAFRKGKLGKIPGGIIKFVEDEATVLPVPGKVLPEPRKRGRPPGSKNKPKDV